MDISLDTEYKRRMTPSLKLGTRNAYLSTMTVNVAFHIHTNRTCALIQNGKLGLMIK